MASRRLPHRDADWSDLVPGAIAVGLGVGVVQVVAVCMLGPYALSRSTKTYGALGLTEAVPLGLSALGRLLVGAAEINATLWERERTRRETTCSARR